MKFVYFIPLILIEIIYGLITPELNDLAIESNCTNDNLKFHNHTPFSYIINETDLCFGEVFLLSFIQSSPVHFKRRMMIRETWGSLRFINNNPVRLMFIIGYSDNKEIEEKIKEESKEYRDIVQGDFKDSYKNLTLKHIVGLHWIVNFCSQARFITKSDDDTFISIFSLVSYLKDNFKSSEKWILGKMALNETPIREPGFKWTISYEMYPNEQYPPFLKGFAYIISNAAVKPLFICSFYQNFLFIDDVFITGLVARLAQVQLKSFDKVFGRFWITNEPIKLKSMDNLFFISQSVYYPAQWKILWKNILKNEL